MYLLQLYKKNKGWFAIVVLFAFGQLFINYKNGILFSPFYNYDMYAYPTYPQRQYEVVQVRVNGKLLQPNAFSPQEWDNIIQPVVWFNKEKDWNSYIFSTEVQRFLPVKDSGIYLNHLSEKIFMQWYKQQVLRIAGLRDTNSLVTVSKDTFLLAQQYGFFQ